MAADIQLSDRLDDDDYPAYTMGRAAAMLGTKPHLMIELPSGAAQSSER